MRIESNFSFRTSISDTESRCLETIAAKTTQSIFAALALLTVAITARAESEMATVIKSFPIYDPSSFYLECRSTISGEQQCLRVARPDKQFPLPIGFVTTVKLADASIKMLNTSNSYSPGVHVTVEYEVVK